MAEHSHTNSHQSRAASTNIRRLALALVITLVFVIGETLAGFAANSLALLTDAAHNFTDVIALGLAWIALRLAERPATAGRTYGYHRAGILIALFNSTTLVLIALGIFYEAYLRLMQPPHVNDTLLIIVAGIAFVVNLVTALIVRGGSARDLNLTAAYIHLAADAVSTLAAAGAGVAIMLTGWVALDAVASLVIAVLIIFSAWRIIGQTLDILMENTPRGMNMDALVRDVLSVEGVKGVHDVHAWSITENMRAFSAHILTDDVSISVGARIQSAVNRTLHEKHGIAHATLQLECEGCEPDALYCELDTHEHTHEKLHHEADEIAERVAP